MIGFDTKNLHLFATSFYCPYTVLSEEGFLFDSRFTTAMQVLNELILINTYVVKINFKIIEISIN